MKGKTELGYLYNRLQHLERMCSYNKELAERLRTQVSRNLTKILALENQVSSEKED